MDNPGRNTKLTVVCPPFSELNNDYQESGEGNGIGEMTKSGQLFMSNTLRTFNKGSIGDAYMARLEFFFVNGPIVSIGHIQYSV